MADIKKRKVDRGSIKTMDRSIASSHRIRNAASEIREAGRKNTPGDEESGNVNEYATARMKEAFVKTEHAAERGTARAAEKGISVAKEKLQEKQRIKKFNEEVKEKTVERRTASGSAEHVSEAEARLVSKQRAYPIKSRQAAAVKKSAERTEKTQYAMKKSFKNSVRRASKDNRVIRRTAEGIVKGARNLAASAKALFATMTAGGAACLVVIVCCVLFGAAFFFFGDESSEDYTPVSAEVEAYTPVIQMYCDKYGIPEYTELIKAVMMQESGGKGKDPMQAAEGPFNKKYPHKPNGIKDPEYSIECGVQELKSCLDAAGSVNAMDIDHIKLALQGYNFGNGYITWAKKNYGGYSKANAIEFSQKQAKKKGWDSYGDISYVEHVLRYYPYGNYSYDVEYTGTGKLGLPIKGMTSKNITSHFGPRSSPGGIGSTNHQGLDIGFPTGTHVLACEKGTVATAGWGGGLGNCIIIDHDKGLQTVYGHLSAIKVKTGQKVARGQYIGNVGSTGNSTGPHLHLGIKVNGSYVNPEKGWLNLK